MPATLKDVAKKVGKSTTTVSRALNDFDDISSETKERVRRAAAELGYIPNTTAQRLQKKYTDTIGLVIPTFGPRFSDPFFSEFLAGVGNKAASFGYDLLVSTRPPGQDELQTYQSILRGRRVDGFVVVRTRRHDERIDLLIKHNFPFVAFGRTEKQDFPFVDEDGTLGMALVTEHLVSLGHTRLACIAPPPELMFTHHRLNGVQQMLAEHGLQISPEMMLNGDLTQRSGYAQTRLLLDLPNPPTAILACNDLMALGAMSAIQERGLEVGKDLSITGFDNIPLAENSHPPLTTVQQPIYQIGSLVCEMLIHRIRKEPLQQEKVILQPSLVIRRSTGPAPHPG